MSVKDQGQKRSSTSRLTSVINPFARPTRPSAVLRRSLASTRFRSLTFPGCRVEVEARVSCFVDDDSVVLVARQRDDRVEAQGKAMSQRDVSAFLAIVSMVFKIIAEFWTSGARASKDLLLSSVSVNSDRQALCPGSLGLVAPRMTLVKISMAIRICWSFEVTAASSTLSCRWFQEASVVLCGLC